MIAAFGVSPGALYNLREGFLMRPRREDTDVHSDPSVQGNCFDQANGKAKVLSP